MESLLSDTTKFKQIESDPTSTRENSLTNYLLKMKKLEVIDNSTYWSMKPSGSNPGIMYGLPKVHKPDCPMRPIVSSIGTYNYHVAKYLVKVSCATNYFE